MARKFIAGSNVAEALEAVRAMRTRRLAFTIDLLGEATITEVEADHVQKQYLELVAGLTREVNHWPEERPILSLAKKTGAFVNFDMEQHSYKDTTLKIFRDILTEREFRDWPHVGIAI